MALSATSYLAPQFQSYKFYWIKFYEPGTTQVKAIATDVSGSTLIAKAEITNKGFLETAGGTVFIPFIDGFYDAYLFPNEADADANDTSSAVRIADNINATGSGGAGGSTSLVPLSETIPVVSGQLIYPITNELIPAAGARIEYASSGGGEDGTLLIVDVDYIVSGLNEFTLTVSRATGSMLISNNTFSISSNKYIPTSVTEYGATDDPAGTIDQLGFFNSAAAAVGSNGFVVVPPGTYKLSAPTTGDVLWYIMPGVEMVSPTNYPNNNVDNVRYLTGRQVQYSQRGENVVWFGATDYQWVQDIRTSILGTATVNSISSFGKGGYLAACRTSDKASASQGTIGYTSYISNDDEVSPGVAYGIYKESIRYPNAGTTFGEESNVTTYGTMVPALPSDVIGDTTGVTVNFWVGGPVASGPLDGISDKDMTSAGIVFSPGGATHPTTGDRLGFDAGIVFSDISFLTSPEKEVLRMGNDMQFAWYGSGGTRTSGQKGSTESTNGVQRIYTRRGSDARITNYTFTPQAFSIENDYATLGAASRRWSELFATNGTINTSDATQKQQVADLTSTEQTVALACKALIKTFKWNTAVAEKGAGARIHTGVIAQSIKQAFIDEGLDAHDYGLFTYDLDAETSEETYGIRYTELLCFIIGAM